MDLVLISPEDEDAREAAVLPELFAAGLRRYHLRKPGWSAERMSRWLSGVAAEFRARIVPHDHHELVERFGLAGRHWPDRASGDGFFNGASAGSADPERGRGAAADDGEWSSAAGSLPHGRVGTHPQGLRSRSCHDLADLAAALGAFDSVFFGPVFPSISKPGRRPDSNIDSLAIAKLLGREDSDRWRTRVLALGGVTAERVRACRERGFDGVAVLGAVWGAVDPVAAFRAIDAACRTGAVEVERPGREVENGDRVAGCRGGMEGERPRPQPLFQPPFPPPAAEREPNRRGRERLHWLMCLTLDGLDLSHEEQARRLCAAGARWVQVRMKEAGDAERRRVARACARACREHGAICVINDRLDVALDAGADGIHLGREDGDWAEARRALGPNGILGGTVNDEADAARAIAAGCLDYAGIGPFRFTSTKRKLSPVLGVPGIARLARALGPIPAWAIGGVTAGDAAGLRRAGAAGVAVSSALYRGGNIEANLAAFLRTAEAGRARTRPPDLDPGAGAGEPGDAVPADVRSADSDGQSWNLGRPS